MKNKFWLFYAIAVSLVLSFGIVSASVPTVEDISNPSITLTESDLNNTQEVICRYSDGDAYDNISYSDSYFDLGSLVSDSKVNFTSADVNNISDLNGLVYDKTRSFGLSYTEDIEWKPDGSIAYVLKFSEIRQYNVTDPWNISTMNYDTSFNIQRDSQPEGFSFKSDGSKVYMAGYKTGSIFQYNVTDPWNISSLSFEDSVSHTNVQDVKWKPDGSGVFVLDGNVINRYFASDPWNISTIYGSSYVLSKDDGPRSFDFNHNGSKMYVTGTMEDEINQWKMSDSWNFSTLNYERGVFMKAYTYGIFSGDSDRVFYQLSRSGDLHQYNMYPSASIQVDQIPYYRSPGNYPVTCEVNDTNSSDSLSENLTVNTLLASDVNVSSVNFGSLSPGSSSVSNTFKVENMGNVNFSSNWSATNFTGPSEIGVDNLKLYNYIENDTWEPDEYRYVGDWNYQYAAFDEGVDSHSGFQSGVVPAYGSIGQLYMNFTVPDGVIDIFFDYSIGDYGQDGSFNVYGSSCFNSDKIRLMVNSSYQGEWTRLNCWDGSDWVQIDYESGINGAGFNGIHYYEHTDFIGEPGYSDLILSNTGQNLLSNIPTQNPTGNRQRYYLPKIKFSVPLGTPTGAYTNTFTHSISQA